MWSSGQCARLLSDDPSSNPAEANSLLGSKLLFEKNGDKQNKRPRLAHLKTSPTSQLTALPTVLQTLPLTWHEIFRA